MYWYRGRPAHHNPWLTFLSRDTNFPSIFDVYNSSRMFLYQTANPPALIIPLFATEPVAFFSPLLVHPHPDDEVAQNDDKQHNTDGYPGKLICFDRSPGTLLFG